MVPLTIFFLSFHLFLTRVRALRFSSQVLPFNPFPLSPFCLFIDPYPFTTLPILVGQSAPFLVFLGLRFSPRSTTSMGLHLCRYLVVS